MKPFEIKIEQSVLDDLNERLSKTRWTDEVSGAGWDYGTNLSYLKELVNYWRDRFDWRRQEDSINQFNHFRNESDGFGLHFIHERAKRGNALPLLMLHGFPASFLQMSKIIPLLIDPEATGGDVADSFDVIVPSLPGYGFSDRPREKGMNTERIARLFHRLVTEELGYPRYAVRASDLGAGVAQQLCLLYPDSLIGAHLSGTNPYIGEVPGDLTEAEKTFVENAAKWQREEMAYAMEHSTKPQTLAYGLNDSPAGMAAWIVEKVRKWSNCDGELERRFTKDELLTNLTVYWATETINSSIRLYYETAHNPGKCGRSEVPTAMLMAPKDMFPTPREWAERTTRIDRWRETERGGHFLEWEEPELVAEDLREFFRSFR
jgi:pimeloyl-ACP methyl ester carboxylesterase